MECYIFCASEISDYTFLSDYDFENNFVICVDGGYRHAQKLNISVDLWLGDNDSLLSNDIKAIEIKRFNSDKDKTDTNLAIDEAIARGFKSAVIFGGTGGRIDHEFSHFCLLKYALLRGLRCKITDSKNEIMMIDDSVELVKGNKKYVSFFPFCDIVKGLTIKGLKYSLENEELRIQDVRASSNEFLDENSAARVSIRSGFLLVILSDD